MKNLIKCVLLTLWFNPLGFAQDISIVSYNIRFDNPADKPHTWSERLPLITQQLSQFEPDFIGFQEVLHHQLEDLKGRLPSFQIVGVGRDDGKMAGEYAPLFIHNQWKIIHSGTFWLSSTPEKVSKGWDAALPRIVTWAKLKHSKLDVSVFLLNTHFDHVGQEAREQSAKVILDFIKANKEENEYILVCGDFNVGPQNPAYNILQSSEDLQDSYLHAQEKYGPVGTFNAFKYDHISPRIDYIWTDKRMEVLRYEVRQSSYKGILPSDHWPVWIQTQLKE